jgi:hypothetical protein
MSVSEGGQMEAAYVDASRAEVAPTESRVWPAARSLCAAVVRALAANARGGALDRVFTTSSAAGFAALPRSQQNRLLDSGFRP